MEFWNFDSFFSFSLSSAFYTFKSHFRKTAIPLATIIVASQFSKNGLDDTKDIDETKKKYLSSNQDVFYPLPGQNVSITRSDLQTLSPREIRLKIFRQIVEPFYYENLDEKTKKQAGVLAFINQKNHKIINQIAAISLIPLILSLTGLIFFSYKYGKLISPAVVFLFVSTLPAAFLFIIANARADGKSNGPIPFLPNEIAQETARTLAMPYNIIFFAGIGFLITMFVVKIFKRFTKK